jgi:hypothetical protein
MSGTLAAGGGAARPASSCAIAHRRGPLPAAPMPRTPPQHAPRRNAPWVTRSASWPDRSSRAKCAMSRENVTVSGSERRALSGSAPPASTVLRIPLRGTRLRRAVDPGDLCRPSGPDGEGQAKGQARKSRDEPLSGFRRAGGGVSRRSCMQSQNKNARNYGINRTSQPIFTITQPSSMRNPVLAAFECGCCPLG